MPLELRFEDEMIGFCRRSTFKQYVREAINDELFWKQIFNDMRINNQVDTALSDKVPERVRNYLTDYLPAKVTQEIMHQLPNVVSNNYQMQQLFQTHKEQLKSALDSAASTILAKIVDEDQYHEVNRAYFVAFNNRADKTIDLYKERAQRAITEMQTKCDRDLKDLHTQLVRFQTLQNRVDSLRAEVTGLSYGLYFLGVVVLTSGFSLALLQLIKLHK